MDQPIVLELKEALIEGDVDRSAELTRAALAQGVPPKTLVIGSVKPAADDVGAKYENGEYFLANLVRCGDSFKAAIKELEGQFKPGHETGANGNRALVATVEGDIHDIGKNLVVTFLQGDGFVVEDMGVDVPAARVVDKAVEMDADVIALSCLMSVTRNGVKDVCAELERRGLRDHFVVLVGGAATSERWAKQVGCDGWAGSATEASHLARRLIATKKEA